MVAKSRAAGCVIGEIKSEYEATPPEAEGVGPVATPLDPRIELDMLLALPSRDVLVPMTSS